MEIAKKVIAFLGSLVLISATFLLFSWSVSASGAYPYVLGGTGSSTIPAIGQVFYAGSTAWQSVATSTLTPSSPLTGSFIKIGSGSLGIQVANTSQDGYLTSIDWNLFNNKDSFAWPFTSTTNFGALANSTSTPIWFRAGLMSSSTVVIGPSAGSPFFYGNSGLFSISSTSPWAQFAINPIAGQGSNQFVVGSSTATNFIINNAGNVGIGTTSPGTSLSIGNTGGVNVTSNATSTWGSSVNGINITNGCYAIGTQCLSPGLIGGGTTGAVKYATTAALPSNTYSNGTGGVGATITEIGVGALSIDGNSPTVADRVLIKDEGTGANNGIYTVTAAGSGIAAFVLTRALDYNDTQEITPGIATYVINGTSNTDTTWAVTFTAPLVVGTGALTYIETANGAVTYPISIANGGTNATSMTTSGNSVYYNGTRLATALTTTKVTTPYASSTAMTASGEVGIPNAASSPTLTTGDIALDTTAASSSLRFNDGVATRSIYTVHTASAVFASSTLAYDGAYGASGTTTLLMMNNIRPVKLASFYCKTDVGTAWVGFGTGSATTTEGQCSSTGATVTLSSVNTWTMRQNFFIEIGRNASAPNNITVSAEIEEQAD